MRRIRTRSSGWRSAIAGAIAVPLAVGLLAPATAAAEEAEELPQIVRSTSDAGFTHPGVGITADQLENAREQVLAGTEPWASHYEAMTQSRYAALDYVAENAGPTDTEPKNDAYDQVFMRGRAHRDSYGAMTQALMYYMTGDEAHRANALHVLRTWSSLDPDKYAYFADAHIHTGVPLYQMLVAAEIVRSTDPVNTELDGYDLRWTAQDQQRIEDNLVRPVIDTFLFSQNRLWNQHLYGVIGTVSAAIFLDDAALYDERVEWFTVNSTYTSEHTINGGDVNGALASLLRVIEEDDPLNTTGTSYVQHMEMGRDQAHAEGDITLLTALARIVNSQGTLLDPRDGTVSTAPDAVSPYAFLDDRILQGADVFAGFMMGEEIPWTDTSGGQGAPSQAYRGRLRDGLSELYYQYTYEAGVDVEREAPHIAELHERRDGPLYHYGPNVENFWNDRGSDFTGAEYWVAFPPALAAQDVDVPELADTSEAPLSRYGHVLGKGARMQTDSDGAEYVRLKASAKRDAVVGVRRMVWSDTGKTSLVGIRVRTDGPAVLQAAGTSRFVDATDIPLPDTGGEWRYVWLDLDATRDPASRVGQHLVVLRAVGDGAKVDVAGVLAQANGVLTPPTFDDAPSLDLVAVAGEELTRTFAVSDTDGDPVLGLQEAPRGTSITADGTLTWTPRQRDFGTTELLVVASDETTDTVLPVTITVVEDRAAAVDAYLADLAAPETYTTATWTAVAAARDAALDGADSAGPGAFAALLEDLRRAVVGLDELNPRLADGTLDLTQVVTSPQLSLATLRALTDGDNQTTWGDQRVRSILLDAGPGFRLSADAFGFLARDTFPNRAEGTNVYGSDDAVSWTLLTEHPNVGRDDRIEDVAVRAEVRDSRFRFLKLQVDEPGVPSDPAFPGIWSLADLRIHGERTEAVGSLDDVALTSPDAVAGRVVAGDAAELRFSGDPGISDVEVTILRAPAEVTSTGTGEWVASSTLGEPAEPGSPMTFEIDFVTPDGRTADPVAATTDGSKLYHSTDGGLVDGAIAAADVVGPDGLVNSALTADAAKLFDGNPASHTDTRQIGDTIALTWDLGDGGTVALDGAEILVRQDGYGISRIANLRLEGSHDRQSWNRLTPAQPAGTLDWQRWQVTDDTPYRYLRLVNGQIMGVAELRLFGEVAVEPSAVESLSISSDGPAANSP
ncbi:hypothetical protein [Isoptericola croceus]|uniref:hypothetical protein n=1 Tax=Isoptericola croceus TaxID=3031406 RepID=UPI0023F85E84|nr:hypothetical protein [Isoptericola croceus]